MTVGMNSNQVFRTLRRAILFLVLVVTTGVPALAGAEGLAAQAQQALQGRGYYSGPMDGKFGDALKEAIRLFQEDSGLKQTGRLDKDTFAALGLRDPAAATPSPPAPIPSDWGQPVPSATEFADDGLPPAMPGVSVQFLQPQPGQTAPHRTNVRWRYSGLARDTQAWVVVVPKTVPSYHPQGNALRLNAGNGTGKGLVYLGAGPHANQGEAFDILLVAVTPAGSQQLTTYLRNANLNRDWPGEYSLPDNSQLMGKMTVTRR